MSIQNARAPENLPEGDRWVPSRDTRDFYDDVRRGGAPGGFPAVQSAAGRGEATFARSSCPRGRGFSRSAAAWESTRSSCGPSRRASSGSISATGTSRWRGSTPGRRTRSSGCSTFSTRRTSSPPSGPSTSIVLPDVIEHVPLELHGRLFAAVERILARPGRVLLTYPSPEYQEYLKKNEPKALQLVDETVELEDILATRRSTLLLQVQARVAHEPVRPRRADVGSLVSRGGRGRPLGPADYGTALRKRFWRFRNRAFLKGMRRRFSGAGGAAG